MALKVRGFFWRVFAVSFARVAVVLCGSFFVVGAVMWAIAPLRDPDNIYVRYVVPLIWIVSAVLVSFVLDLLERVVDTSKDRYWGRVLRLMVRKG